MKKPLIIAAWLLGLIAIAWSCSGRQSALHALAPEGADALIRVAKNCITEGPGAGGSA